MHYSKIKSLQKEYGFKDTQDSIDSGMCWKMEGSVGRHAMELINSGACMLPKVIRYDAYGNRVPSRDMLKDGSKGTFKNSVKFWTDVYNGDIDLNDY